MGWTEWARSGVGLSRPFHSTLLRFRKMNNLPALPPPFLIFFLSFSISLSLSLVDGELTGNYSDPGQTSPADSLCAQLIEPNGYSCTEHTVPSLSLSLFLLSNVFLSWWNVRHDKYVVKRAKSNQSKQIYIFFLSVFEEIGSNGIYFFFFPDFRGTDNDLNISPQLRWGFLDFIGSLPIETFSAKFNFLKFGKRQGGIFFFSLFLEI